MSTHSCSAFATRTIKGDSERLGGRVQGYSFWTSPEQGKPPIQVGVSPDRTADGAVMFGYAFYRSYEPDGADKSAAPYRHPHSFYFSGYPVPPDNAPIVSQNYTEFSMTRPDPEQTWNLVAKFSEGKEVPAACNLFSAKDASLTMKAPTWEGKRR